RTTLTGIASAGATTVNAGSLFVNGTLTTPSLTVFNAATLGGIGTVNGNVLVLDGGALAPGNSPGTLTVGSLALSPASILNYELGTPNIVGSGVNDLIEVNGNLTLDGVLNISAQPGYGLGVYRLMDYSGSLTNGGLDFGAVPAGFAYQVDLVVP